jgi:hypothetical protein
MAQALDLDEIAQALLNLKLATIENGVVLANSLEALSQKADVSTLRTIARLLLKAAPPSWIWFAVHEGKVFTEYVPSADLQTLAWIGEDLDLVLADTHEACVKHDSEEFRKAMGDAAEFMVVAALRYAGLHPSHVSRLSDAYGYDIECIGPSTDRIEVKSASEASMGSLHITRNEFEKCIRYGLEWRLLQVVFTPAAFAAEQVNASHVKLVRELRHGVLSKLIPKDTPEFKWTDSAQISPPEGAWQQTDLALDPFFSTAGFIRSEKD